MVKPPTPKEVNMDSLSYYKNHPKYLLLRMHLMRYVLERHLRREEALKPGCKVVRKFTSGKGDKAKGEEVYNRSDVYICRTVENWYKEGKRVKEGETPMKTVKARPMTLTRKREHEIAMAENDDQPIMEGLYATHQVELYLPPPIENGVIPKNGYGNIDLFVDSMLPPGAVHIPCTPRTTCPRIQSNCRPRHRQNREETPS
jgi:xeroderma pigmentosum group C-complementing protein